MSLAMQIVVFWAVAISGRSLAPFQKILLPRSSTVKKEAPGFSEMLVTIYQTTQRHISEDSNLQAYCDLTLQNPSGYYLYHLL
jgi:hypothetical protein